MNLKFILAGCFLFFSLNTFAEGTIDFLGFGSQEIEQLCIVTEAHSTSVQVSSVYAAVKKSNKYVSFNCQQIISLGSPIESLNKACAVLDEDSNQNLIVSKIDIDFLDSDEVLLLNNIKDCN